MGHQTKIYTEDVCGEQKKSKTNLKIFKKIRTVQMELRKVLKRTNLRI